MRERWKRNERSHRHRRRICRLRGRLALAESGIPVTLCEMKPQRYSPAHHYPGFAELICSNSFKASRVASAAGLLKAEMERLGSLTVPWR